MGWSFGCHSFQLTEKNGGDDGTRTRGLCRDRAATTSKSLKSNGVGRHSLVQQNILSHCYRPLNVPRSEALVRCPRLASRFKVQAQDIATRDANTSDDFSMTVCRRTFSGKGAREDDAGFK